MVFINLTILEAKKIIFKWSAVCFAFSCLLYPFGMGHIANIEEVQYSGHWPGTILLFSIVTNQIQNKRL